MENSYIIYLTQNYLQKKIKSQNPEMVLHLSLSGRNNPPYKINQLENLESLKNLTYLDISQNLLKNLINLKKLSKLSSLDASSNCFTELNTLPMFSHLVELNLSHNKIKKVPENFAKQLPILETLNLSHNQIDNVNSIRNLRKCKELIHLNFEENPLCEKFQEEFSMRLFIVYYIKQLQLLDNEAISLEERHSAQEMFDNTENKYLNEKVETFKEKMTNLELENITLKDFNEKTKEELSRVVHEHQAMKKEIEDMAYTLKYKDQIIKKHSNELMSHYYDKISRTTPGTLRGAKSENLYPSNQSLATLKQLTANHQRFNQSQDNLLLDVSTHSKDSAILVDSSGEFLSETSETSPFVFPHRTVSNKNRPNTLELPRSLNSSNNTLLETPRSSKALCPLLEENNSDIDNETNVNFSSEELNLSEMSTVNKKHMRKPDQVLIRHMSNLELGQRSRTHSSKTNKIADTFYKTNTTHNPNSPNSDSSDNQGDNERLINRLKSDLGNLSQKIHNRDSLNRKQIETVINALDEEQRHSVIINENLQEIHHVTRKNKKWKHELKKNLIQLDESQCRILNLENDLRMKEKEVMITNNDKETLSKNSEEMKKLLEEQKEEIKRLNDLLDLTAGIIPSEDEKNAEMGKSMPNLSNKSLQMLRLKNSTRHLPETLPQEYLCNVPEHHRLEDLLQNSIKQKNALEKKYFRHKSQSIADFAVVDKIEHELEKNKNELERVVQLLQQKERESLAFMNEIRKLRHENDALSKHQQPLNTEYKSESLIKYMNNDLNEMKALINDLRQELNRNIQNRENLIFQMEQMEDLDIDLSSSLENLGLKRANSKNGYKSEENMTQGKRNTLTSKSNKGYYQNEVKALDSVISSQQNTLKQLEDRIQNKVHDMDRVRSFIQETRQPLEELHKFEEHLPPNLTELNKPEDMTQGGELLRREFIRVRDEVQKMRLIVRNLSFDKEDHTNAIERLKSEEYRLKDKNQEQIKSLEKTKYFIDRQKETLAKLKETRRIEEAKLDGLTQKGAELMENIERLRTDHTNLQRDSLTLQRQNAELLEEKSKLEMLNQKLLESLEVNDRNVQTLERDKERIETELKDRKKSIEKEIELKKSALDQLSDNTKSLQGTVDQLKSERRSEEESLAVIMKEKASLNFDLSSLSGEIMKKNLEAERLDQNLGFARSNLERIKMDLRQIKHEKEVAERGLQESLDKIRQETRILKEQFANLINRVKASNQELADLNDSIQNIERERNKAIKEIEDCRETKKNELDEFEKQKRLLSNQITCKTEDLERVRKELSDIERLMAERNSTLAECEKLRRTIDELKNRLVNESKEMDSKTSHELTSLKLIYEEKNRSQENEINSLREQLANEIRERKKYRKRAAKEIAELERIAEEQCSRSGLLTNQLASLSKQYAQLQSRILAWENDIPIEKLDESTFYFRNISARQSSNKDNIQSPPSREQNSTEPSPDNHYPASKATRRPTDSSGIGSSICVSNDFANLYQEPSTHPRDLKDHLRLVRSTLNETKMLNEEKERQHPFQNCLEIDVSSGNDVQRFISDNLLSITDTLLTLYPNKVSPSDSSSSDNLSLDESI